MKPPPPAAPGATMTESEYQIGHCVVCNGSGKVGILCQDCEDSGMIYEASATSNTNSEAESEAADQPVISQTATGAEQWETLVMCATLHI